MSDLASLSGILVAEMFSVLVIDVAHVICSSKDEAFNIVLPTQASSIGAGSQVLLLYLVI